MREEEGKVKVSLQMIDWQGNENGVCGQGGQLALITGRRLTGGLGVETDNLETHFLSF